MLAVKAKHAAMLLTVSDIEEQQEMDEEKSKTSSMQAITVRSTLCILKDAIQLYLNKYTDDQ